MNARDLIHASDDAACRFLALTAGIRTSAQERAIAEAAMALFPWEGPVVIHPSLIEEMIRRVA